MNQNTNKYHQILNGLKEKIRQARFKAALTANAQLLAIYWELGNTILEQQKIEGWGAKIIDNLSQDLKLEFPDFKGLSVRNLKYMRSFAEAYPDFQIMQPEVAQLPITKKTKTEILIVQGELAQLESNATNPFVQSTLAQITWYHHITLLDKVKDRQTRLFYIQQTVKNGWSRDIMLRQIDTGLHKRIGSSFNNFENTLPAIDSDLAKETFKSSYVFDFLTLSEEAKEKDLERPLYFNQHLHYTIGFVQNQQNILLEKLYHELPDKKEFENILDKWMEEIVDNITQQVDLIKN